MISTHLLALGLLLGPSVQDSHTDFRSNFQKAMEIKATTTMAQLVKRNQEEAVSWILQTAESISVGSSEELAVRMSALRIAWKTSMDTGFASKMEEYFSLLEPTVLRERAKLKSEYNKLNKDYWDNKDAKDGPTYNLVGAKFAVLAENFAKIGDHYFSSQCWGFYGICFGTASLGDKADLYKACRGSGSCVSERLLIELTDNFYRSNLQSHEHLIANGYGEEPPADGEDPGAGPSKGGGAGAGKAPAASGKELTAPLVFKAVEERDDFVRPSYFADDLYVMWSAVYLGKKGNSGKVANLQGLSPKVLRSASSEVTIDIDGDGVGDEIRLDGKEVLDGKVGLTGNMRLVQFKIGEGSEQREWACHFATGLEKDLFQGFERGMGIYDESVQLFHFNAASVVGEIAGEVVQVLDDNSDGVYGSPPVPWDYSGLSKGNQQHEMDSVRIGSAKRAGPWSEYQQIGDAWFRMAISPSAAELIATPVTLQTGKLKLKFKGGKPTWLVVRGKGKYEGSYFDVLANGSKGVEVPVGSYELFCGELRKGKGRQAAKALILPGAGMEAWEVTDGKTITLELGGPFSFDFAIESVDRGVKVNGETVVVVGAAGERYERPWNCRAAPDVYWRDKGKGRGNKAERMKLINDQFVMLDVERSYQKVWFPLDCEFEVKAETVEVQLQEKKNTLFGKLESGWKE
jgi:hypothetical protein